MQKTKANISKVAPAVNVERNRNAFALCILASIEKVDVQTSISKPMGTLDQVMLKVNCNNEA